MNDSCPTCGHKKETICIDFDGVIYNYELGYNEGKLSEVPIAGAQKQMARLVEKGYNVVILTARLHPSNSNLLATMINIKEWLTTNGFIQNQHYHIITNNKPPAVAYIDDRAIRFENNWYSIGKYF